MELNYKLLYEANRVYGEIYGKYNVAWIRSNKTQWDKLYELSGAIIEKQVLKFLNEFGCRIPVTDAVIEGIRKAHLATIPYIDALRNEVLWDLDLDEEIMIYSQKHTLGQTICAVFDAFSNIGYRFSHVAASKLLHRVNPFIFMMWDNGIISHYGVRKNSEDYVYRFLPLMKDKLNQVIQSYMDDFNMDRAETVKWLNSYKKHKTLLKLLDEYNWLHTRSMIPSRGTQSDSFEICVQPTRLYPSTFD